MALVEFGSGVSKISGKVGDIVYGRNRGGNYQRAFAIPTQPSSGDQVTKWQIWIDSADLWNSLNRDQLQAWREYALQLVHYNRLGNQIKLSAQQLFTECYTNAALWGLTPLEIPTEYTNRPGFTAIGDLHAEAPFGSMSHYRWNNMLVVCPSGDVGRLIIQSTATLPPTIRNVNNRFRQIWTYTADSPPIDLTAGYTAKFGAAAVAGYDVHIRARVVDGVSMLGSTWVKVSTPVTVF